MTRSTTGRRHGCKVPRRPRRRIVGRWEQIEREAREEELKELERELHGEQKRDKKPRLKPKRRWRKRKPDAPDTGAERRNDTDSDG